ncbi:MAG TPA: GNAT family N-acetyltransferase [Stellaceae bacterium]
MSLTVRPLEEADVDAADKVRRLAFGTYFGIPDPLSFSGTACLIETRRHAWPDGALVAEKDGAIAGIAISSRWGTLGLFGPLAVHPEHWRGGVAHALLDASIPIYDRWQCRASALFTFPSSLTHIGLYQRYGFWPRSLTAIMNRPVTAPSPVSQACSLTAMGAAEQQDAIAQCGALTDRLYAGMDLRDEIATVVAHPTSDAIVLIEGSAVAGFLICHFGSHSEADTGVAYAKFAAARPGPNAARDFQRLIDAANDFAHRSGATRINAGVNMGAMEAYRLMIAAGFRSALQGIAMHRPWTDLYDQPDIFALEDWR